MKNWLGFQETIVKSRLRSCDVKISFILFQRFFSSFFLLC